MTLPPPIPAPSTLAPGWWCRHWRWAMPLAVLLFLAALGGAIAWSVLRWTEAAHDSAPMREAMRRAGCSVELVQVFGEPLQAGTLPLGSMQTAINGERDVGLTVALEGPHAHGRLFVKGTRSDDVWDYPVMYVLAEDKQTFDLSALDDAEAAGECELQACRDRGECALTAAL
ncbi:cytochrome c oxidase assembly factor Coa1 family protein [Stenotrophomonas indicatrix]|uniref:cytochrome c oxidase assembly factor Coa1 family protein n=1 Tax=Stenotrophomonas indicatrix TaxID=2045451 RepID=UPI0008B5B481|nr:cytochrome c oxidase assembly factor Coa1 family protein [Stenotrophomonas indicatrix]SET75983.1 Cytochrome oxidase complex assembly protein 1 [Stenotrophomonas indicatrix]